MNFYNQRHDYSDEQIADPGEQLDDAIDRIARDADRLADLLGDQVKYLKKRHELVVEMTKLEKHAGIPMKTLEKRVGLLQQISAYGAAFADETLERLKERIACIQTINRLEPNGEHASIKKLRERARLLERATPPAPAARLVADNGDLIDEDGEAA
jgi:hypothetical protein